MRFKFRTVLVIVALPYSVIAQQRVAQASLRPVPVGEVRTREIDSTFSRQLLPTTRAGQFAMPDSATPHKIGRYTLNGLLVGGVIGFVGGAVGAQAMGCGCSEAEKTLGFGAWFGAISAVAGAIVGAVIGGVHDYLR